MWVRVADMGEVVVEVSDMRGGGERGGAGEEGTRRGEGGVEEEEEVGGDKGDPGMLHSSMPYTVLPSSSSSSTPSSSMRVASAIRSRSGRREADGCCCRNCSF